MLVVDDEAPNRSLLEALLVQQGYEVCTAADGADAIAMIKESDFDLLLLDLMMPKMDGIEVCRHVRSEPATALLPIIFTTSRRDRESRVRAKEAGADDFLLKPIDALELLVRVENLLRVRTCHQLLADRRATLERELEIATTKLMHMERLSTVGALASGVGHELANLATIQRGAIDQLEQAMSEKRPADPRHLAGLERVAEHLGHHASRLLHLGGRGRGHQEVLNLGQVVNEAVELIAATGRTKHARITTENSDLPTRVVLVRMHFEQVLFNLVLNSSDALEGIVDRPRTITLRLEPRDQQGRARVHVIDTGTGIAEDILERVFDPYFTTKGADRGTGLGLTLVKHVIEEGGGHILISSQTGVGTTITIDFPALSDEA